MKVYFFYFKNDNTNLVYNTFARSKKAVRKYVKEVFGSIDNLVIDWFNPGVFRKRNIPRTIKGDHKMAMLVKIKCLDCGAITEIEGMFEGWEIDDINEKCEKCGSDNTEIYETDSL